MGRTTTKLVAIWLLLANSLFAQRSVFIQQNVAGAAPAGITFTGKTCLANNPSAVSVTCNWAGGNPAAGENVYCVAAEFQSVTSFTVTDDGGNTYTANGSIQIGYSTFSRYQMFYFAHLPGAITSTTVTPPGAGFYLTISCISVAGGSASPVDGAVGFNVSASGTSSSTSVSPSSSNSIVYGMISINPSNSVTAPGAGYTFVNTSLGNNMKGQYQIFTSSGTKACGASYNTSTDADIICAAYK